jgi:hypothetical protein
VLDERFDTITAVIIDYNQLVFDSQRIKAVSNPVEYVGNVVGFTKGGYHKGQLGRFQ